jgi:hypothetical protein
MFKKALKILFAVFCIVCVFYLALPNYSFPEPPPGSIQSQEPADLESPLRRGYFTNLTRAEVLAWYEKQFNHSSFYDLKLPTLLLNYPPENAQTLIRDQTGSTFLQEFVHPFRESEYINGFQPPSDKNRPIFFVEGKSWQLKIIVRQVPSSIWLREVIFLMSAAMIVIIYNAFEKSLKKENK